MKLSELAKQIEDFIAEHGDVEVCVEPEEPIGSLTLRFRITDDGFGNKIVHLSSELIC